MKNRIFQFLSAQRYVQVVYVSCVCICHFILEMKRGFLSFQVDGVVYLFKIIGMQLGQIDKYFGGRCESSRKWSTIWWKMHTIFWNFKNSSRSICQFTQVAYQLFLVCVIVIDWNFVFPTDVVLTHQLSVIDGMS